ARLAEGAAIQLSTYTSLDDTGRRYFKNKQGGLGQYYLGSLRELGVMLGGSRGEDITYTTERGLVLAQSFDAGVSRRRFFEVLEADKITTEILEELQAFCACRI